MEITLYSGGKAANFASYLPQSVEEHERACHALARLPLAMPYHLLILGGDLQGGWTRPTVKDVNVHAFPFLRWKGAEDPTFVPRSSPA